MFLKLTSLAESTYSVQKLYELQKPMNCKIRQESVEGAPQSFLLTCALIVAR